MSKESSHTKEKTTIGRSSSSEVKKPAEKELSSSTFVNQGKAPIFSFLELDFFIFYIFYDLLCLL